MGDGLRHLERTCSNARTRANLGDARLALAWRAVLVVFSVGSLVLGLLIPCMASADSFGTKGPYGLSVDPAVGLAKQVLALQSMSLLEQDGEDVLEMPMPALESEEFEPHGVDEARLYLGQRIRSIELRLPTDVDPESITPLVSLRAGGRLDRRELRRTVRVLYETGRFRQVRAHVRDDGDGLGVTFVLSPRQRVAEISFLGAEAVDRGRLDRAAGIARGDDLSSQAVERVTTGVKRTYARFGYRDARVTTEVRESQDGQVALFVFIDEGPVTRLSGVRWEGETGLPEDVLHGVLGLRAQEPIDLNKVDAALDRLRNRYRKAGYLQARVGLPRVEPIDRESLMDARDSAKTQAASSDNAGAARDTSSREYSLLADLVIPVSAGPLIVTRVFGNTFMHERDVRALLYRDEDGLMDSDMLWEGVRRVEQAYRLAGYHHVEVDLEEVFISDKLTEIHLRLIEGPPMRVRSISFEGARNVSERWMRQQVCMALEVMASRQKRGPDPKVLRSLGGRADYRRTSLDAPAGLVPPEPCEVFERSAYRKAMEVVADQYRRLGWLEARLEGPLVSVSPDRRVAHVDISVEEGVRTHLREVRLEGVESFDVSLILTAAGLSAGEPLSAAAVENGKLSIRRLYAASGHPFAAVEAETLMSRDRRHATVVYRVSEGPRVKVGRVIVRGHYNTPASLVRSQLTFSTGDEWNLERVQTSQRRILSVGIYRSASIRLLDPDEPAPVMDVVVSVRERRPKAIEMGVGLSTEDGPRLFAEYADHVFLWNSELRARAKLNYPLFPTGLELRRVLTPGMEWEAQAGLRFPTLLSARTDLVGERANRPTFGLTRAAWSIGADTRWRHDLTASLGLEMEYVDFERAAPDPDFFHPDLERRRFEEGRTLLASLRPGVTLDLRDRPVSPRSGVLAGAGIDWSHDLGVGIPVHFLKATASVSTYLPTTRRTTLALSARGGMVVPLSEDNVTIEPKRFFLGGADTLRGFPLDGVVPADQRESLHAQLENCHALVTSLTCTEDSMTLIEDARRPASAGGESFVLLKGELRFPIAGGLQGGLFLDAGNLWRDGSLIDLLELRTSAGGGLRYETPIGPVAVDLGLNLAPDRVLHETPMALHFAIGLF